MSFRHVAANVIDLRKTKKSLVDICMDETGGLGVDCVIDNGGESKLLFVTNLLGCKN